MEGLGIRADSSSDLFHSDAISPRALALSAGEFSRSEHAPAAMKRESAELIDQILDLSHIRDAAARERVGRASHA